ncbi:MAG: cytochrome c3 family protein [Planctomycetota bacterium]|jgi:predicted CXXCH cytochrome family protein
MLSKRNAAKVFLAVFLTASAAYALIEGSPHDLTPLEGGNPCLYCHTPHGALPQTPGWSHKLSEAVYTIYQSSSLEAKVGQPTGSSKLCLSCHDGTVALAHGATGEPIGGYIEPGAKNLGTDLSDDHPISFVYSVSLSTEDPQIRPPSSLPDELKLGRSSELQCTTCHDPHDNQHGDFLVLSNRRSQMCVSCHDLYGWSTSSHENSIATTRTAPDLYLKESEYGTPHALSQIRR